MPRPYKTDIPQLLWTAEIELRIAENADYNRITKWKQDLLNDENAYPKHIKDLLNVSFYNRGCCTIHDIHDSDLESDNKSCTDDNNKDSDDILNFLNSDENNLKRNMDNNRGMEDNNKRRKICLEGTTTLLENDEWRVRNISSMQKSIPKG